MAAARLLSGTGDPNGVVYGDPGDLYTDDGGGTFYYKATGVGTNTGWIPLSSASNVLTFSPDSAFTGPAVFNNWGDLYAQLDALRTANDGSGIYTIVFVRPEATADIPAGTWDMDRTSWISQDGFMNAQQPGQPVEVNFTDGTIVTNLTSITGLRVENTSTTAVPADGILLSGNQTLNLYGTVFARPFTGRPCVTVTGGEPTIRMADESAFLATNPAVEIANGSALILDMDGANTFVFENSISQSGGGILNANVSASSARFDLTTFTGGLGLHQRVVSWGREMGGNPNGVVDARLGSLFVDHATGSIYKNSDGALAWTLTAL